MRQMTAPRNQFEGATLHEPRPSRHIARYRYLGEGELTRLCDEWDESERARQHWAREGERVDADIAARQAAAEQAGKERDDAITNDQFRRRYLAGGGDPSAFERNLPGLREEHARRCALGLAEPLNSVSVLKEQLRQARLGRNLGAAPHPTTTATDDA
jgi:hypothetical protein